MAEFRETGSGGLEVLDGIWKGVPRPAADEIKRLTAALEKIALLDEADGHELTEAHAFRAVALATGALFGRHPSEILADRISANEQSTQCCRGLSVAECVKIPEAECERDRANGQ
jgi:hypothetical protein